MPYLSVIVPTYRVGGLDVLFESLSNQTFKDFELILVDSIREYRAPYIEDNINKLDFQVKHISPIHDPYPYHNYCRSANTGIINASGEVVVLSADHTWFQPNVLEVHANFHKSHPVNHGLMCPNKYLSPPPVNPVLPVYNQIYEVEGNVDMDKYVSDIKSGLLNDVMYSIYINPLIKTSSPLDTLFPHPEYVNHMARDPKNISPIGPILHNYFCCQNESMNIKHLFAINGFDEDLDFSHSSQDSDMGERLTFKAGVSWFANPINSVYVLTPRWLFPRLKKVRYENVGVWESKKRAGYPKVNKWDLSNPSSINE
jgi:glycosyltransferase involved in cell wall biosynthesis